jgi:hypothetical protein
VSRAALAAAALCLLAGCAGHRSYSGDYAKNLGLRTSVQSGMRAAMDVYSVDGQCRAEHQGRVALDEPRMEVGLPQGRASLLVFEFAGSRFLGSRRTSITKNVMLVPRAGRRYEARVEYRDDLYDVELKEIDPRTGASRELDGRSRC